MFRNTQTYILVTLIALLVWVLAEAESVQTRSRSVDITFADPDWQRAVRVQPGERFDGRVTIELEGPAARIDEVVNALARPLTLTPELLGLPLGEGRGVPVDLKSAIARHPVFEGTGVRPSVVRPGTVGVMFDDMVTREMRVAPPQPDGLDLEGVPEVSPRMVTVRVPSSVADQLAPDATLQAVLDAPQLARLTPGRPQALTGVRVEFPPALRAGPLAEFLRAEPATVTVNATRRGDSAETVVASVPVRLQIAPIDQPQWDITVAPEAISDVRVRGPRDIIGQIDAGKVQVFAVVPLTWAELEAISGHEAPSVRGAAFVVSTDTAAAVQFEAPDKSVRLTVRRRAIVGPPPPSDGQ